MKISVCMAVYNGQSYLRLQIESILAQLGVMDEIVIVNDASQDDSLKVLKSICDNRIRVYDNEYNQGILASFEKALKLAEGDILFLSDQDDIWLPEKITKFIDLFSTDKNITLVTSDAQIIDEFGDITSDSFFAQRGQFTSGILHNLFKNKYLGCTIAFRSTMLKHFLPIPNDVPMHDMWFGILNEIYGLTYYIDQPLIAYRRHGKNVSSTQGADFTQRFIWRWRLLKNLFLQITHHFFT